MFPTDITEVRGFGMGAGAAVHRGRAYSISDFKRESSGKGVKLPVAQLDMRFARLYRNPHIQRVRHATDIDSRARVSYVVEITNLAVYTHIQIYPYIHMNPARSPVETPHIMHIYIRSQRTKLRAAVYVMNPKGPLCNSPYNGVYTYIRSQNIDHKDSFCGSHMNGAGVVLSMFPT